MDRTDYIFVVESPYLDLTDHIFLVESPYLDLTDHIFLVESPNMDPKSVHFWKSPHIWTLSQSISGTSPHIWPLRQSMSAYFINSGKAFFSYFPSP